MYLQHIFDMKVSYLIIIFSFLLLLSCSDNHKQMQKKELNAVSVKYTAYYKNGQRKFLVEKKKNISHGIFYRWTKNGQIKTKGQFKNGKRIGTWEWFDERGVTCMKIYYQL